MSPHRAVVGLVVGGLSMGLGFSPSLTIPSRSGHVLHHSPARRFSMSVAESEPAAAEAAATGAAAAGAAVADAAEADAAEAQATGAAQPQGSAPPMLPVTNDWAGLPAAIRASRCGALTNQLVKAADAEAILKLTAEHVSEYNQINCATAMHHLAKRLKTERAQRERTLRDSRFEALLERTVAGEASWEDAALGGELSLRASAAERPSSCATRAHCRSSACSTRRRRRGRRCSRCRPTPTRRSARS